MCSCVYVCVHMHVHACVYVPFQAAQSTYTELDQRLFDSYIEQKSDPIIGAMEPLMYRGAFSWKTCPTPTGNVCVCLREGLAKEGKVSGRVKQESEPPSLVP